MPPWLIAIRSILDEIASWLVYLVPALITLQLIVMGMQLSKADDSMEKKEIKEKATRVIFGVALIGGSAWLANWLWGKF